MVHIYRLEISVEGVGVENIGQTISKVYVRAYCDFNYQLLTAMDSFYLPKTKTQVLEHGIKGFVYVILKYQI